MSIYVREGKASTAQGAISSSGAFRMLAGMAGGGPGVQCQLGGSWLRKLLLCMLTSLLESIPLREGFT